MALLKHMDLLATFRDKIKASTAIASFLTVQYPTETLTIYTGVDRQAAPGTYQTPFITLDPQTSSIGESEQGHSYSTEIAVGLKDGVYSDFQSNGTIEMKGCFNLDTLCFLVIEELRELSNVQNWIADDINLDQDSTTNFPLHIGFISITSAFNQPLGYDTGLTG